MERRLLGIWDLSPSKGLEVLGPRRIRSIDSEVEGEGGLGS